MLITLQIIITRSTLMMIVRIVLSDYDNDNNMIIKMIIR